MTLDPSILQAGSLLAYLLVFLGGIVTSIGPCNVAMIPLVIGYVGGSHNLSRGRSFALSLTFAVGLAITFMLLGVIATLIGGLIGGTSRAWYYVVAGVCLLIGLHDVGCAPRAAAILVSARLRERIGLQGMLARWPWGWFPGWWPRSAPHRCWPPS